MIDRTHALPVSQQARLVRIARSSVYYRAQPVSEADQLLMHRIDELYMEFPFAGARLRKCAADEAVRGGGWQGAVGEKVGDREVTSRTTYPHLTGHVGGSLRDAQLLSRIFSSMRPGEVLLMAAVCWRERKAVRAILLELHAPAGEAPSEFARLPGRYRERGRSASFHKCPFFACAIEGTADPYVAGAGC